MIKIDIFSGFLGAGKTTLIKKLIKEAYAGEKIVTVAPFGGDEALVYANTLSGKDTMRIQVSGHREQAMVTAIFDNLGKGASGAAIQNMNILLGVDETTGLNV